MTTKKVNIGLTVKQSTNPSRNVTSDEPETASMSKTNLTQNGLVDRLDAHNVENRVGHGKEGEERSGKLKCKTA